MRWEGSLRPGVGSEVCCGDATLGSGVRFVRAQRAVPLSPCGTGQVWVPWNRREMLMVGSATLELSQGSLSDNCAARGDSPEGESDFTESHHQHLPSIPWYPHLPSATGGQWDSSLSLCEADAAPQRCVTAAHLRTAARPECPLRGHKMQCSQLITVSQGHTLAHGSIFIRPTDANRYALWCGGVPGRPQVPLRHPQTTFLVQPVSPTSTG